MSSKNTGIYTLEFKQSSAKLAVESAQPIAQTARDLGVKEKTLYGWVGQYYPTQRVQSKTALSGLEIQLKQLQKENARLKQERDILKKAAAYFANATQ